VLRQGEVLSSGLSGTKLSTHNSEFGEAVDSELGEGRWFSSIAVENYDTDGSHHSNNQPHHNYLTEYLYHGRVSLQTNSSVLEGSCPHI